MRLSSQAFRCFRHSQLRSYSSLTSPISPFAPRHLLSIADLSPTELNKLIINANSHKQTIKFGSLSKLLSGLERKTIAMIFNKLSTRTRVSTEAAVVTMGGHPMFLGKSDIQLGVNETLYDTSVVISSMVSAIVARVGPHSDVAFLAKHSTVPVINALSDIAHPLQTIADCLTIYETFPSFEGMKIAWIGDANNVLFDLALATAKLGANIAVATPKGYEISKAIEDLIKQTASESKAGSQLSVTNVPEEAIKDADIIVTDTWVSMGQEEEKAKRIKEFEGFQVTSELAERGGAKPGWRFMHCLPRHQEEVSDEVFYSPRSLVFPEAENRLWAAIAALEGFVVNKGEI